MQNFSVDNISGIEASFEFLKVNCVEKHTIETFETTFRQTTEQRNLSTLEMRSFGRSGTTELSFMSTSASFPHAGAIATTYAFPAVLGTRSNF
jgi:hypothetical protein